MISAVFVDRPQLAIIIFAPGLRHQQLPRRECLGGGATVAQPIEAQVIGVDKI